ncbi:hypothetical protein HG15A2_06880 [Adhaeretor mobilis]|uniref:Uncharacterized protein n=1 Tax=Adhaeretor mobilis TaxID=1930276 RepID=A0A517MRL8_9BACT|nr:hypothetical protein HG15A2_06880 [Adhaeretor mobilis]
MLIWIPGGSLHAFMKLVAGQLTITDKPTGLKLRSFLALFAYFAVPRVCSPRLLGAIWVESAGSSTDVISRTQT